MTNNLGFYYCSRRYKWPNNLLEHSLEHNWPIITRKFVIMRDCYESCMYNIITNISTLFVSKWHCLRQFWQHCVWNTNFAYNVNLWGKVNKEVPIFTKLNYKVVRGLWCIKAMCSTKFIPRQASSQSYQWKWSYAFWCHLIHACSSKSSGEYTSASRQWHMGS